MILYDLGLAWRSIRRSPALSALLVGGVALGIGVSSAFVTVRHVVDGNPLPHKADSLFYVRMDSWDAADPWDDSAANLPPNQITYREMEALLASDIPTRRVGSCKAAVIVHPENLDIKPFRAAARMTNADFFPMFEVPFLYGSGWDREADARVEPVVVIDSATNDKLFGGGDSVGKHLRIRDRELRVVGVIAPWRPTPKLYDPHNGAYQRPEGIYLPFGMMRELDLRSIGNTSNWGQVGPGLEGIMASEMIWIQFWVELPEPAQRAAFAAFLDDYVREQKALGRFPRPLNNRLQSVMEFLRSEEVAPPESRTMRAIGLLFLVVSAVNLIGILLGKFLARAPEVGVRRALGASRAAVFRQHLVECEVLALAGGLLGLGLAHGLMQVIGRLFFSGAVFRLDLPMVGVGIALALVAGLIAGVYPAWRVCHVAPASYLKRQ
jgi:putative ABC transport system permease protein